MIEREPHASETKRGVYIPVLCDIKVTDEAPLIDTLTVLGLQPDEARDWRISFTFDRGDFPPLPKSVPIDISTISAMMLEQAQQQPGSISNLAFRYVSAFKENATEHVIKGAIAAIKDDRNTWPKPSEYSRSYRLGAALLGFSVGGSFGKYGFDMDGLSPLLPAGWVSLFSYDVARFSSSKQTIVNTEFEDFVSSNPRLYRRLEQTLLPVFPK